ncbi:hypothetical protein [Rosenbergiella epipactidis]|uniref:hypothetical protein n=1 Tax=Rosenbergiella epipactidis TaxID=1544694 RepID=UPI001F4FB296|nr:hypothetical protein [Rosenbergiella epipactidis]
METKEIQTKYGVIYGRDALVLSGTELKLYPFGFSINTSLSLSACKPEILNVPDVKVKFIFSDIEMLSIYKIDEYPYEKFSKSSFDYVDEAHEGGKQHIILSTYDHVFDIIGRYEVEYN